MYKRPNNDYKEPNTKVCQNKESFKSYVNALKVKEGE